LFQSTGPVTPATSRPSAITTTTNTVNQAGLTAEAGIIKKGSAAYNDILNVSGIDEEILNRSTNQGNV